MVKSGSRFRVALMLSCLAVPAHLSSMVMANDDPSAVSQTNARATSLAADDEAPQRNKDGVKARVIQRRRAASSAEQAGDEKALIEWSSKAVHGEPPKAWLGIGLKEVTGDLAIYLGSSEGVLIESIFPDSPAEAAKLQEGDLILAINGEKVVGPVELVEALRKLGESQSKAAVGKAKEDLKVEEAAPKQESNVSDDNEKAAGKKRRDKKAADDKDEGDADEDDADEDDADEDDKKSDAGKITYPNVKLTILRRGREMVIEVAPKSRPEALKTALNLELQVGESGELPEMLKDLPGGARVFRFGTPSTWPGLAPASKRMGSQSMVVVVKNDDGKSTEVRIEREGDKPPKMILIDEKGSREIEESDLEELPKRVQEAIKEAIGRRSTERTTDAAGPEESEAAHAERHARIQADVRKELERVQGHLREGAQARVHEHKSLREALQKLGDLDDVIIVGPEVAANFGKSAEELAQKYQKLAEEVAKRSAKAAKEVAAVPLQLQELQAQVTELKKQIQELQAQLKAEKR